MRSSEPDSLHQIHRKLKPLFGLAPKYYLAILYSFMMLVLVFYLTFWHGLTNPGTFVRIDSQPQGASVRFRDKLYGHTPLIAFLPEGSGELRLSKPLFDDLIIQYQSGNQVFFGGLFPRRDYLVLDLPFSSQEALPIYTTQEIGRWSSTTFSDRYPAPPLFVDFVQNAQAQKWDQGKQRQFLIAHMRYVADPFIYSDFGRACGLWQNDPPESLQEQYDLWKSFLQDEQVETRLILWLFANQPKGVRSSLLNKPTLFLQDALKEWQNSLQLNNTLPKKTSKPSFSIAGYQFIFIPGGEYHWGLIRPNLPLPLEQPFQLPVPVKVKELWLSRYETTQAQFAKFIYENPSWAPSQRLALIAQGKVDKNYLSDWRDDKPPHPLSPVTGVSWYASVAYLQWFNSKFSFGSKEMILPSEIEWEWAAREAGPDSVYREDQSNIFGLVAMMDGVWEWTRSSWAPGDQLIRTEHFQEPTYPSYYRVTKGGCNETRGKVAVWDRGISRAASCNPYLGFRVALKNSL